MQYTRPYSSPRAHSFVRTLAYTCPSAWAHTNSNPNWCDSYSDSSTIIYSITYSLCYASSDWRDPCSNPCWCYTCPSPRTLTYPCFRSYCWNYCCSWSNSGSFTCFYWSRSSCLANFSGSCPSPCRSSDSPSLHHNHCLDNHPSRGYNNNHYDWFHNHNHRHSASGNYHNSSRDHHSGSGYDNQHHNSHSWPNSCRPYLLWFVPAHRDWSPCYPHRQQQWGSSYVVLIPPPMILHLFHIYYSIPLVYYWICML